MTCQHITAVAYSENIKSNSVVWKINTKVDRANKCKNSHVDWVCYCLLFFVHLYPELMSYQLMYIKPDQWQN